MNTSVLVSIIFLATFLLNAIFGKGIVSFWDLINGVCLALAIQTLAPKLSDFLEKKNG